MPTSASKSVSLDKQLFTVGYLQARRLGLKREDAQDCAMDFVTRTLTTLQQSLTADPAKSLHAAWLQRCAYNHACNYARALTRRRQREADWTAHLAQTQPAAGPGPKTLTLRKELWNQVAKALQQLAPGQRDLFVGYHLRNQSVRDLALRTGRTQHAIEASLSNTRKRLAVLLLGQGWTEAEAQSLFRANRIYRAVSTTTRS